MKRKPHSPTESIFARGLGIDIVLIGVLLAAVSLGAGIWAHSAGHADTWQTMIFTTLTLAQMGNVLAVRSETDSVFSIGFFSKTETERCVMLTVLSKWQPSTCPSSEFSTPAADHDGIGRLVSVLRLRSPAWKP